MRAVWTRVFGTNMKVERIRDLRGVVPADLLHFAEKAAADGVPAEYQGPRGERKTCKPHPSVSGKLMEVVRVT